MTEREARNQLIQRIADALDTAEEGENLVDVARAAHECELILARVIKIVRLCDTEGPKRKFAFEMIATLVGER